MLQCVAVCCSVLQCIAVCCSVLQSVALYCSVLQCVAVCYGSTNEWVPSRKSCHAWRLRHDIGAWVMSHMDAMCNMVSHVVHDSANTACTDARGWCTAYCICSVIWSRSPISISLVSFQRNVAKETHRTRFLIEIRNWVNGTPNAIGCILEHNCSVSQCVAVCWRVLQCDAVCCSVLSTDSHGWCIYEMYTFRWLLYEMHAFEIHIEYIYGTATVSRID